jgi:hypothetical protein
MAQRFLTDLDVALGAAGIPFTGIGYQPAYDPTGASSWQTRGRPASTGDFQPEGVLCHHTASPAGTSDRTDLQCILAGNSSAPGPISQLYVGRQGNVYIVAAGRCNHGGGGRRPGIDTGGCADMNELLVGIEAGNNGVGEFWPDVQTEVYANVVAALCDFYGWDISTQVFLHATTGPPSGGCNSKIDPAGPWQLQPNLVGSTTWNLETWRGFCRQQAGAPIPPIPNPPDVSEEDVAKCIVHVDDSQPAGSPGYYRFNAIWNWSGTTRFHLASEIGVKSAVYENTGDAGVFGAALGDIMRNPSWVQPVGSLDGYGAVVGNDPGDV